MVKSINPQSSFFLSRRAALCPRSVNVKGRPVLPPSNLFCYLGINRTYKVLKQHFWWPLVVHVREYIAACVICAQNVLTRQAPSGLLHPLPIPSRPWSHMSPDFVTGLTPMTTILTRHRFSKMVHFIPLPKLPSAKETAKTMLQHIFQAHGFPKDIFVWEFCRRLGVTV